MLGGIFEKNKIEEKIKNFDQKISQDNFWKDKVKAQKILKEKNFFENISNDFKSSVNELENLEQLLELAIKEADSVVTKECEKKINLILSQIKKTEVSCFLSSENDFSKTKAPGDSLSNYLKLEIKYSIPSMFISSTLTLEI